ncbi:CMP-N-acetylneuraminate-poly-alpha-2,8-sialyltransferase-like isoform X2 [Anneissia japonica]|uniref:CMP-N-acetylneuraminate-poly-alpha-2, 8-sialyltransferase-like isoform X2 n=1 Tax=Anneissia japonica TaxID=1529436 RepID=UPI001425757C|nr:CMP-N-acetylneuraminate-poly-alpha-2,8-sialyltransferase-like isoform X2 [Anneissia japonica]
MLASDKNTGKLAAIKMVPQTFQFTTHTNNGNRESRPLKQIKRINLALSLRVKVLLVLTLGLLVAVDIVLYLSTTEAKIKYKFGLRKSKNVSALVRSRKPNVLRILDKHVNTENVEKLRKTLESKKMTSKMFFHPTKTNTILQIGLIPIQDSCAVIGSSGVLKGSSCGREIDAHDFVIRENMAPVKGFESDVGTRTSLMTSNDAITHIMIRCLQNPSKPCHKKYSEILKGFGKMFFGIPVYQDRPNDQKQYNKFFSIAKSVNSDIDFRIPLHKFRGELDRYWKLPKLSSGGFLNVNIAFTFCKRISLYGFFPFSQDLSKRKLKYHYFDNNSMKGGLGVHSMPVEYNIFKELHNNHTLRHVIKRCI